MILSTVFERKILVCVTPQSSGVRLIDKGYEIACKMNGALHILHVEKGESIFMTESAPQLLEKLFQYGSGLNGVVHGICGEDIPMTICQFIREHQITHVVLGVHPPDAKAESEDIAQRLKTVAPYIEVIIVEKEN